MADRPLPQPIAVQTSVDYLVRPTRDRDELRRILAPHRAFAAYAIGQLRPELFSRSEWWVARGSGGQALLLHSRGGLGNALFSLGTVDALDALLRLHPGPRHTFLTCETRHLETVVRYYDLKEQQSMLRMLVDRETFRPADGVVRRLSGREVGQINRLYRSEGTLAFYSAQNIDGAIYYGAYEDNALVSVAGTHVISPSEGVAVVGNVFTHPDYRGIGLATRVTGAVTRQLLESCREVVLSVDPRNTAAVRAYQKLGYREVGRLIEGPAVKRGVGLASLVQRRIAAMRGRRYGAELVSIES